MSVDRTELPIGTAWSLAESRRTGQSALVTRQGFCPLLRVLYAIAIMGLLSGCTPANETGVGLSSDGVPTLHNCGTWFGAVVVSDRNTGREIWSAEKSNEPDGHGVGDLTVGVLPNEDWGERFALVARPRPAVWRFEISYRGWDSETIDVADEDLRPGFLVVPGKADAVAVDAFGTAVCGEGIGFGVVPDRYVAFGLGVVALLGAGAMVLSWARRRHAQSA